MKFEVGKKYIVRDPVKAGIAYVEVVMIDHDLESPIVGKILQGDDTCHLNVWTAKGHFWSNKRESAQDLVAESIVDVATPLQLDLQVGKKYIVRDPERTKIKHVEILAIDTDLKYPIIGKIHQFPGEYSLASLSLDGFSLGGEVKCDDDLVAEYVEPVAAPLQLGPEHVGRRVRLRNGDIVLITRYRAAADVVYPVHTVDSTYTREGRESADCDIPSPWNIVEVLD